MGVITVGPCRVCGCSGPLTEFVDQRGYKTMVCGTCIEDPPGTVDAICSVVVALFWITFFGSFIYALYFNI